MLDGNRLRLLVGGEEAFEAMKEAMRSARERLWVETFILMPDAVGRELLDLMKAAARRGVDVALIVDHPASFFFSLGWYRSLERVGARVMLFNPIPPWEHEGHRVGSLFNRDHRKILVADDVAICGGHNLSKAYVGPGKRPYFDISVRVEGPAVRALAEVFAETAGQMDQPVGLLPDPPEQPGGVPATVLRMDRKHGVTEADHALLALLHEARERCALALAYFLPERWLVDALTATAARGVDVRLLTAGRLDVPPTRPAARHVYGELLAAGVRVFELRDQKLHAKAAVADGRRFLVGSFDYNRVSAEYSLEVALLADDPQTGERLGVVLEAAADRSREIDPAAWARRGRLHRAVHRLAFEAFDVVARARSRKQPAPVPGPRRDQR